VWILYRRMYANRHIYTCIFAVWVLRIPLITTAVSAGLPRLPIHPAKIYEVQSIYWAFRDPLATKAFSASLYVPIYIVQDEPKHMRAIQDKTKRYTI